MMNKKGQTLVIFILFLPIIAFLIIMIINKSKMYYDKRNMENVIKEEINYEINKIAKTVDYDVNKLNKEQVKKVAKLMAMLDIMEGRC